MSNAVTALNGASWNEGLAAITEVGLQGMITLRGDLESPAVKAAATAAAAVEMPGAGAGQCVEDRGLFWMSPDEVLILCAYADVATTLDQVTTALSGEHFLAVDVSDARASFRVSGAHSREVLAKLCPVDLSPAAFKPGQFRRTRLAQVPAAFWTCDDQTFQIICFRSVAQYVFDVLKTAAQPNSAVGVY